MKQQKLFLLCCGIMLNVIYARAKDYTYTDPATNVVYKYSSNSTTASVTESKYATGDIAILSSFTIGSKTFEVTSIGSNAFRDCSGLTSVIIPESVTLINRLAFLNCSSLTSISIPQGVKKIGEGAFEECTSLTSVTIPESVTYIDWYAFSKCI